METHAGEHSVQALPLGIRERRESPVDNLKRRNSTIQPTKAPQEIERMESPSRIRAPGAEERNGGARGRNRQFTSREHAVRRHLEALLNDFWRASNLPGAAGSIGGGLRTPVGRRRWEEAAGGWSRGRGRGGDDAAEERGSNGGLAWLAAEGGRREAATARLSFRIRRAAKWLLALEAVF